MTVRKTLVTMAASVILASPASASTTNQRVLILDVTRKNAHRWDLSVLEVWGSKLSMDRPSRLRVEGKLAVFLDGKKSTPEEAFRPGHTFRQQGDNGYYECYSTDFRFPDAKAAGEHDGVYQLMLTNAGRSSAKGKKGGLEDLRYDVYLHLEIRNGAIAAAGATGFFTRNRSIASLPVDVSGLRLEADRLRGPAVVTYLSYHTRMPAKGVGRLPRTHVVDVTLGRDRISGSYTTESEGEKGRGVVSGRREKLPERRSDCTIWLSYQAPLGLSKRDAEGTIQGTEGGSLSLRLKDGTLVDGLYSATKGYATGIVEASTLKIDGNRIEGEVTYSEKGAQGKVSISGVLVGHRIFGECRRDGKGGRIRGGVRVFDCPPFMCWSEKVVSRWLKEHPDQPLPAALVLPKK